MNKLHTEEQLLGFPIFSDHVYSCCLALHFQIRNDEVFRIHLFTSSWQHIDTVHGHTSAKIWLNYKEPTDPFNCPLDSGEIPKKDVKPFVVCATALACVVWSGC